MKELDILFNKYNGNWNKVNFEWASFIKAGGGNSHVQQDLHYKEIRRYALFYIPPAYWFCECMLKNVKDLNDGGMWSAINANIKDFRWMDRFNVIRKNAFHRDNEKIHYVDWDNSRYSIGIINLRTGERININRDSIVFLWFIY